MADAPDLKSGTDNSVRVRLPLPAQVYFKKTTGIIFACRLSSVVEQCFCKAWVVGSNPTVGSFYRDPVAQLDRATPF